MEIKIEQQFRRRIDYKILHTMYKRTDRQTDGQGKNYMHPWLKSGGHNNTLIFLFVRFQYKYPKFSENICNKVAQVYLYYSQCMILCSWKKRLTSFLLLAKAVIGTLHLKGQSVVYVLYVYTHT